MNIVDRSIIGDRKRAPEMQRMRRYRVQRANNHSRRPLVYSCVRRATSAIASGSYDASESASVLGPQAPAPSTETHRRATAHASLDRLGALAVKGWSRIHRGMFAEGNSYRRSETTSGLQHDRSEAKHSAWSQAHRSQWNRSIDAYRYTVLYSRHTLQYRVGHKTEPLRLTAFVFKTSEPVRPVPAHFNSVLSWTWLLTLLS